MTSPMNHITAAPKADKKRALYLKFPGPFPVASIRLKYVARPKAAERFVPRKDEGAEAHGDAGRGTSAAEAHSGEAAEIAIPEPPEPEERHPADDPGVPDLPPEPAGWQGELALFPLPGEAGDPQPNAATAETADAKAPESGDETPDAGSAEASPPDVSAGGRRASDWG